MRISDSIFNALSEEKCRQEEVAREHRASLVITDLKVDVDFLTISCCECSIYVYSACSVPINVWLLRAHHLPFYELGVTEVRKCGSCLFFRVGIHRMLGSRRMPLMRAITTVGRTTIWWEKPSSQHYLLKRCRLLSCFIISGPRKRVLTKGYLYSSLILLSSVTDTTILLLTDTTIFRRSSYLQVEITQGATTWWGKVNRVRPCQFEYSFSVLPFMVKCWHINGTPRALNAQEQCKREEEREISVCSFPLLPPDVIWLSSLCCN